LFFVAVFFTALSIFYLFHCHSFYLFLFCFFFLFFSFLFLFNNFIVPFEKFGSPLSGKARTAAARRAPPVPTSVCAVFTCVQTMACHPFLPVCVQYLRVFKQWHGCQCLEFLTCAQMMHAIAHENCTNTVKPILNWAHYLFAECTSDSSPNYNSFIN